MSAVVKARVGEVANDQPPKLPTLAEFRQLRLRNVEPTLARPWEKYPDLMDWRNSRYNSNRMYEMLPTSISDEMLAQAAADCADYMDPISMEEAVAGDRLLRNRFPDWEKLGAEELKGLTLMWGESFVGFPRVLFQEAIKRWFNNPKAKRAPTPGELKEEIKVVLGEARAFARKIESALEWLDDLRTEPMVVLMECLQHAEKFEHERDLDRQELERNDALVSQGQRGMWNIDDVRARVTHKDRAAKDWRAEPPTRSI